MNPQIVILLAVAVCAFTLPVPDEEATTLQKSTDLATTPADDLVKPEPSLITTEEGTNALSGNVTVENTSKTETESDLEKPTEGGIETTSIAEDEIKEVPKSMPVVAREETEAIAPPFAGVRAEPKETVEISEAKSTATSPDADDAENESEPKPTGEEQPSTESNVSGAVPKKGETSTTEEKPTPESPENKSSATPAVAGENKTEDSADKTKETKKTDKSKKHDHSSEGNKSEESAESKESEESDESNKSK